MAVRFFALAFLLACGGARGGTTTPAQKRGLEAAKLPYSILDARTGRQVQTGAFWTAVMGARVICVGEDHPNPHHHWVQLEVMSQVATRKHDKLALGMEMFQRPFQGVLDDYAANRIDQTALLSRSGWDERWGYDFGFYGPTISKAITAGAALLALNVPKELTKKVVKKGVEALTPDEKRQMPELVLDDKAHRAWFDATMEDMGGAEAHGTKGKPEKDMPNPDRIYTAQVLWDETMADGAAKWSKATPSGTLVLLAGNGHCHDSAIINRIKRRGVDKVISIRPVLDVEGNVAEALAKPMNDYLVVLELPTERK